MTAPEPPSASTELQRVQHYVWSRYVEHKSLSPIDERQALQILEAHHATVPMGKDAECFYYGILAFELSFADAENSRDLLEKALTAFRAYRQQTGRDFTWDAVEDRYQETLERLGLTPGTTG